MSHHEISHVAAAPHPVNANYIWFNCTAQLYLQLKFGVASTNVVGTTYWDLLGQPVPY